jgi:hypothetical protein
MTTRQHGYGFFLLVGIAVAFVTAFTFIAAFYFSLDLERRQRLLDPGILLFTLLGAAVSGLLASPLLFFCLRRKRLSVALPVVIISVLTVVAVLTPFSEFAGLGGAYIALIISVIVCTMLPNKSLQPTATAPSVLTEP